MATTRRRQTGSQGSKTKAEPKAKSAPPAAADAPAAQQPRSKAAVAHGDGAAASSAGRAAAGDAFRAVVAAVVADAAGATDDLPEPELEGRSGVRSTRRRGGGVDAAPALPSKSAAADTPALRASVLTGDAILRSGAAGGAGSSSNALASAQQQSRGDKKQQHGGDTSGGGAAARTTGALQPRGPVAPAASTAAAVAVLASVTKPLRSAVKPPLPLITPGAALEHGGGSSAGVASKGAAKAAPLAGDKRRADAADLRTVAAAEVESRGAREGKLLMIAADADDAGQPPVPPPVHNKFAADGQSSDAPASPAGIKRRPGLQAPAAAAGKPSLATAKAAAAAATAAAAAASSSMDFGALDAAGGPEADPKADMDEAAEDAGGEETSAAAAAAGTPSPRPLRTKVAAVEAAGALARRLRAAPPAYPAVQPSPRDKRRLASAPPPALPPLPSASPGAPPAPAPLVVQQLQAAAARLARQSGKAAGVVEGTLRREIDGMRAGASARLDEAAAKAVAALRSSAEDSARSRVEAVAAAARRGLARVQAAHAKLASAVRDASAAVSSHQARERSGGLVSPGLVSSLEGLVQLAASAKPLRPPADPRAVLRALRDSAMSDMSKMSAPRSLGVSSAAAPGRRKGSAAIAAAAAPKPQSLQQLLQRNASFIGDGLA